jgi:NTP pyrophosphatase (non-canonical NTP hydrolase)
MNAQQYRQEVLKIESKPESVKFNTIAFAQALDVAIFAGLILDQVKRAIYYGKDIDKAKFAGAADGLATALNGVAFAVMVTGYRTDDESPEISRQLFGQAYPKVDLKNIDIRLLHAAIGGFTENGELLEAIQNAFLSGEPIDVHNLKEEFGDTGWYREVGLDAIGATREEVDALNIKKLLDKQKGRYKSGTFTNDAAVNRDTDAERQLLESGVTQVSEPNAPASNDQAGQEAA